MRLRSLTVSGFRAFGEEKVFDLAADAVILVGANGQGKTSLLDAVLWGITGALPRLDAPEAIVSMWSESGEARVELEIEDVQGASLKITRSFDGSVAQLRLEEDGDVLRGPEAESRLLRRIWPDSLAASDPQQALCAAFERAVYLQQDRVTAFISADTDGDRFSAISELVGVGRVTELQFALERSRTAWSTATNAEERDLLRLAQRAQQLDEQRLALEEALRTAGGVELAAWREWWQQAVSMVGGRELVDPSSPEAASQLDVLVKQLETVRATSSRRAQAALALSQELMSLPPEPELDEEVPRKRVADAEQAVAATNAALTAAQEAAATARRAQVEARESQEALRTFAQLALRHLGERCPVCEQLYDEPATRARLEAIARGDASSTHPDLPDISQFARQVEEQERALASAQQHLQQAVRLRAAWQTAVASAREHLAALGIEAEPGSDDTVREAQRTAEVAAETRERAEELVSRGEALSLALAEAGQRARLHELQTELEAVRAEVQQRQASLTARQATKDLAEQVLTGLRDATSSLVEAELSRIEPLLQRIYAAADPHPAFRAARLLSRMAHGRGRVAATVIDTLTQQSTEKPASLLSSSQLNVLAVSVFLALNLGMSTLPLQSAILDDPLQSLDDLNLLGLIDVLRRTRQRRQLIVSTHDRRFADLLVRKLRPVEKEQRTVLIELEGWERPGPLVHQTEVAGDSAPLRLVA